MFKSLIAGMMAIGLTISAAPQKAAAGGDDVLRGVIAGVIVLGTIAALDDAFDDRHRHKHDHVRLKPKYGHNDHYVYRHGKRVYSDRDYRRGRDHKGHGHRHRDDRYRHSDRRNDDYRRDNDRYRGHDGRRKSDYHSHGDYRHKNHGGHKNAGKHGGKKHAGDVRKHNNRKHVKRLRKQKERLIHENARLRRQLERREQYVENLRNYQQ